ncbi:hypothetical protein BMS3Abin01_00796 [bacterium BMS3Abin01]|nr:hypothetical protein BMS3Abin01_00796 [bacterium BMS3Abin01]
MSAAVLLRKRLTAWLPPALSAGCGVFAWALTGALGWAPGARLAAVLAAALGLMAVWLAESGIVSRLTGLPLQDASCKVAVSLVPFIVFPLSSPYLSHRVFSSFLKGNPSPTRLAALCLWLLGLSVAGSICIKLLLFWRRSDRVTAALEKNSVRILWGGTALYFVVFAGLALLAYSQFRYHSDLAQYNQTLWATLRGDFFYSSLEETSGSYLSTHVSPFLLMILPVYALYQSPITILVLRSLALALAAVPLFYCVRRLTGSGIAGLLLSAAFLFHPEIVSQHFTSGYEVVFVAVFFFAAFYFFMEKRFGLFMFFLLMVLTVREDFIPVALVFSFYSLLKRMPWKWVVAPFAAWIVWQSVVVLIFAATTEHWVFNFYYGHFGDSPAQMVKTIAGHPLYALEETWRLQKSYVYNLLMPMGLVLPWTSLVSIFALPNLATFLARSNDVSLAAGGIAHYSVLIVSALWLGIVSFINRAQQRVPAADRRRTAIIFSVIFITLIGSAAHLWTYNLPLGKPAAAAALDKAIDMVPADAPVASNDGRVFPRLSSRWGLYEPLIWAVPEEPDRLPQGLEQLERADYVILKPFGNPLYNDEGSFSFVVAPGSPYRLIFEEDGIKVYRRVD